MIINEFIEIRTWQHKPVKVKMVKIRCDVCNTEHNRENKHYNKMKRHHLFDKDYCNKCWRPKIYGTPEYLKKMADGVRRAYSDPVVRQRLSTAMKGVNVGDKNAMKRPEIREKVSKTRTALLADPIKGKEIKQKIADKSKKAWERGSYIGTNTGRSKWYDYQHSNGTVYKVQGTWELKFIEWLDKNNMSFRCHKDRIPYISADGINRNYYPDFYVDEWNCYVDPKGDHWYNKQIEKFKLLAQQHPNIEIRILRKQNMIDLGLSV